MLDNLEGGEDDDLDDLLDELDFGGTTKQNTNQNKALYNRVSQIADEKPNSIATKAPDSGYKHKRVNHQQALDEWGVDSPRHSPQK